MPARAFLPLVTRSGLETGFLLDRQWHLLRGEMERSKRPALILLARILSEEAVPYAIIGGVALQVHQDEPRTTLDINVAVADRARIPQARLLAEGFTLTGRHARSENWMGPEQTPVQFTDDPALAGAVARAEAVDIGNTPLRVMRRVDLFHEKLRAGSDPARRRSKRLQDLADAQGLLESDPSLAAELSEAERRVLDKLPS
jgi:hypothetical protein